MHSTTTAAADVAHSVGGAVGGGDSHPVKKNINTKLFADTVNHSTVPIVQTEAHLTSELTRNPFDNIAKAAEESDKMPIPDRTKKVRRNKNRDGKIMNLSSVKTSNSVLSLPQFAKSEIEDDHAQLKDFVNNSEDMFTPIRSPSEMEGEYFDSPEVEYDQEETEEMRLARQTILKGIKESVESRHFAGKLNRHESLPSVSESTFNPLIAKAIAKLEMFSKETYHPEPTARLDSLAYNLTSEADPEDYISIGEFGSTEKDTPNSADKDAGAWVDVTEIDNPDGPNVTRYSVPSIISAKSVSIYHEREHKYHDDNDDELYSSSESVSEHCGYEPPISPSKSTVEVVGTTTYFKVDPSVTARVLQRKRRGLYDLNVERRPNVEATDFETKEVKSESSTLKEQTKSKNWKKSLKALGKMFNRNQRGLDGDDYDMNPFVGPKLQFEEYQTSPSWGSPTTGERPSEAVEELSKSTPVIQGSPEFKRPGAKNANRTRGMVFATQKVVAAELNSEEPPSSNDVTAFSMSPSKRDGVEGVKPSPSLKESELSVSSNPHLALLSSIQLSTMCAAVVHELNKRNAIEQLMDSIQACMAFSKHVLDENNSLDTVLSKSPTSGDIDSQTESYGIIKATAQTVQTFDNASLIQLSQHLELEVCNRFPDLNLSGLHQNIAIPKGAIVIDSHMDSFNKDDSHSTKSGNTIATQKRSLANSPARSWAKKSLGSFKGEVENIPEDTVSSKGLSISSPFFMTDSYPPKKTETVEKPVQVIEPVTIEPLAFVPSQIEGIEVFVKKQEETEHPAELADMSLESSRISTTRSSLSLSSEIDRVAPPPVKMPVHLEGTPLDSTFNMHMKQDIFKSQLVGGKWMHGASNEDSILSTETHSLLVPNNTTVSRYTAQSRREADAIFTDEATDRLINDDLNELDSLYISDPSDNNGDERDMIAMDSVANDNTYTEDNILDDYFDFNEDIEQAEFESHDSNLTSVQDFASRHNDPLSFGENRQEDWITVSQMSQSGRTRVTEVEKIKPVSSFNTPVSLMNQLSSDDIITEISRKDTLGSSKTNMKAGKVTSLAKKSKASPRMLPPPIPSMHPMYLSSIQMGGKVNASRADMKSENSGLSKSSTRTKLNLGRRTNIGNITKTKQYNLLAQAEGDENVSLGDIMTSHGSIKNIVSKSEETIADMLASKMSSGRTSMSSSNRKTPEVSKATFFGRG